MNIDLTREQDQAVRAAIKSGRLRVPEEAVREAMTLWAQHEHERTAFFGKIDAAKTSAEQGEGRVITQDSMRELAKDVHERGLARLAAERNASR